MPFLPKVLPLIKRDYWGLKANTLLLLTIILFPMAFGLMFGTFKTVVPRSAPSAVFPEPGAGEEDIRAAIGICSMFSKTTAEPSFEEKKLFREERYFYVGAQKGFPLNGPVNVYIDASFSPISELSPYIKDMILYEISRWKGLEPEINILERGKPALPFQFFTPGIAILLTAAVGFIIIPFSLAQDKEALPRVLSMVPASSFIAGKLAFALIIVAVQLALLILAQNLAGVPGAGSDMGPWTFLTIGLSTVFFSSLGLSLMFLTGFAEAGKQLNAFLFGLTVVLSGAIYPVGFFPKLPVFGELFQSLALANPSYYFTLLARGFWLRGLGPGIFWDYLGIAVLCSVAATGLFTYSITRMRKHG